LEPGEAAAPSVEFICRIALLRSWFASEPERRFELPFGGGKGCSYAMKNEVPAGIPSHAVRIGSSNLNCGEKKRSLDPGVIRQL